MAFQDVQLIGGQVGRTMINLAITKTAALTLQVAVGSVTLHATGVTYTLEGTQSHTFTPDATRKKMIFMGLINNGVSTDLWVDEHVVDGKLGRARVPNGYTLIQDLAWFELAAAEVDILNATVYRRILI